MNAIEGHTPLPWKSTEITNSIDIHDEWYWIAEIKFPTDATAKARAKANAALIVRAVNSHAEMVEALDAALNVLQATGARAEAQQAIEALTKAKGEQ